MKQSIACLVLGSLFTTTMALATTPSNGVAVVGCGVLGTSLCKQLLASPDFEGVSITGITKTTTRHADIRDDVGDADGRFNVKTYDELEETTFKDVVFCAPPSGFDDYPAAVGDAAKNVWGGAKAGGTFVFTSSGGVYGGADGQTVDEKSPLTDTPRAQRLIDAEKLAHESGGAVLRLAGLYLLERGAHNYWLLSGKDVAGRADGIINLLHYDDAAGACMAALKVGAGDGTYLISDGNPLSREGICEAGLKHPLYKGKVMPTFLGGGSDAKGKIYNGSWSNDALKWKPRYSSFEEFMSQDWA